jgi:hypothetical protein
MSISKLTDALVHRHRVEAGKAGSLVARLLKDKRINAQMTDAEALEVALAELGEAESNPAPEPEADLDDYFPRNAGAANTQQADKGLTNADLRAMVDLAQSPPPHNPEPADNPQSVAPATPPIPEKKTPSGSRLPMSTSTIGAARFWRNINGEDVEFLITHETNVSQLIDNICQALEASKQAAWIKREHGDSTRLTGEYTFGVDDRNAITKIKLFKDEFEGRDIIRIDFWATNRNSKEFYIPRQGNEAVIEEIYRVTGQRLTFENNVVGKFAVTVKIGNLKTYKKDVPEKGKKIGDPQDPRYPSSYWLDFISIRKLD